MSQTNASTSGFTVLEALVALAILAGTTSAVLAALMMKHSLQRRSQGQLSYMMQAQGLLERVGIDIPLRPGTVRGTLVDGGAWIIEIKPFREDRQDGLDWPHSLLNVQVSVFSTSLRESVELHTLKRGRL